MIFRQTFEPEMGNHWRDRTVTPWPCSHFLCDPFWSQQQFAPSSSPAHPALGDLRISWVWRPWQVSGRASENSPTMENIKIEFPFTAFFLGSCSLWRWTFFCFQHVQRSLYLVCFIRIYLEQKELLYNRICQMTNHSPKVSRGSITAVA